MAWTINIDHEVNCAFLKFDSSFKISHISESAQDIVNHPDFKTGINILRDSRELKIPSDITFKSLSEESLRIINEINQKMGECKAAVVVGDSQSYAKFHQFIVTGRLTTNPVERKVFRDIAAAREWLDIPPDYEIKFLAQEETA